MHKTTCSTSISLQQITVCARTPTAEMGVGLVTPPHVFALEKATPTEEEPFGRQPLASTLTPLKSRYFCRLDLAQAKGGLRHKHKAHSKEEDVSSTRLRAVRTKHYIGGRLKAVGTCGDRFIPASDSTRMAETYDTSVLGVTHTGVDDKTKSLEKIKTEEAKKEESDDECECVCQKTHGRNRHIIDKFLSDALLRQQSPYTIAGGEEADAFEFMDELKNDNNYFDEHCDSAKCGALRGDLLRSEAMVPGTGMGIAISKVRDQTLEALQTTSKLPNTATKHLFGCPLFSRHLHLTEDTDDDDSGTTVETLDSEADLLLSDFEDDDDCFDEVLTRERSMKCLCHQMTASVTSDFLKSPMRALHFGESEENHYGAGASLALGSQILTEATKDSTSSIRQHLRSQSHLLRAQKKEVRLIGMSPTKILDAPELVDDFYLNTVAWSARNMLAVALKSLLYVSNVATGDVVPLHDFNNPSDGGQITGVGFNRRGKRLAVGTVNGIVKLFDMSKLKPMADLSPHSSRCAVVAWRNTHSSILATGSRDRGIWLRDCRMQDDVIHKLSGALQEVCGLQFSPSDRYLASGGNDNRVYVWDPRRTDKPLAFGQHKAAVKALTWSPFDHSLLATGGGGADRCIKLWDVRQTDAGFGLSQERHSRGSDQSLHKLAPIRSLDTGSQVCSLLWSKNTNELVSTHGYSQNQVSVWSMPKMEKLATLSGHTSRVLYLAASPDGKSIVTGAGDQTLRFWEVFPAKHGAIGSGVGHGSVDGIGSAAFCGLSRCIR